jgi:anti-anti-sigma factor
MPIPSVELRVVLHIAPVREVDVAMTPELAQALADATADAAAEIVLDLRELTCMDSAGMRALAQATAVPASPT